jgi:hypothetical protein
MTATLKDLLTEYAEQARPYEVREQALRRGRRLRRMRMAVPAALAALAVVATGLTVAALGSPVAPQHPSQSVGPSTPGPSPSVRSALPEPEWPGVPTLPPVVIDELERVSVPGYPAAIVTDPDAPPLPTDRGVGRGLLVYTNAAAGWFGLVTESGAQYRLSSLADLGSESLSPGGRWLLSYRSTEYFRNGPEEGYRPAEMQVRDLTGTAVTTIPVGGHPRLWWSADDRWLLAAVMDPPHPPTSATLVDLWRLTRAPQEVDLRGWPGFAPAAVLGDGTVVLGPLGGERLGDVVLVDPVTGDGRAISIDLTTAATPDELATATYLANMGRVVGQTGPLYPLPDGSVLLQLERSFGASPDDGGRVANTDLLVLDLEAGVVRERWRLPEPRPIPDSPHGDWEGWGLLAVRPDGLLLTHSTTQRTLAWELYDPQTGALFLVTDLRGLTSAKQD